MSYYSAVILADNPQAYYRMDETSGAIAHDLTSNHYDAALSGSYTLAQAGALIGESDTSIAFADGPSALNLPYTLNDTILSALSLEFWIYLAASWQYVVVTCDVTSTTLVYLNAALVSLANPATIEIGSLFDVAGSFQAGRLDEIALYNYALSPAKIAFHYNVACSEPILLSTTRRDNTISTRRRDGLVVTTGRDNLVATKVRA